MVYPRKIRKAVPAMMKSDGNASGQPENIVRTAYMARDNISFRHIDVYQITSGNTACTQNQTTTAGTV